MSRQRVPRRRTGNREGPDLKRNYFMELKTNLRNCWVKGAGPHTHSSVDELTYDDGTN